MEQIKDVPLHLHPLILLIVELRLKHDWVRRITDLPIFDLPEYLNEDLSDLLRIMHFRNPGIIIHELYDSETDLHAYIQGKQKMCNSRLCLICNTICSSCNATNDLMVADKPSGILLFLKLCIWMENRLFFLKWIVFHSMVSVYYNIIKIIHSPVCFNTEMMLYLKYSNLLFYMYCRLLFILLSVSKALYLGSRC